MKPSLFYQAAPALGLLLTAHALADVTCRNDAQTKPTCRCASDQFMSNH